MKIVKRNEVDPQYIWATEDLFPADEAFKKALTAAEQYKEKIASFRGRLGASAATLLAYLQMSDQLSLDLERLANYCFRKSDEDTGNSYYQSLKGQFMSLYVEISSLTAFATPEIIAVPDASLEKFYQEQPDLQLYKLALTRVRARRPHILSAAEEKLLAAAGKLANAPDDIGSVFRDADLRFPDATDSKGIKHQVTQGTVVPLMQSGDRELRKSAFLSLYNTYGSFRNTVAALLNAQADQLQFYAKARHYDNTLEAALDATEVPAAVYYNLIDAVHNNLDYMYRYIKLRQKLLGLEQLHMYDIYTPLVPDSEQEIPFEKAKQTVMEAVAVLGPDYQKLLQEGFANRWIDVYENEGKRGGAYSSGGVPHPYVLLNQQDNLDSMFTLAHEMGHALHSCLSIRNQPTVYSDYVIFVAEVASTCNEALLINHLLSKTTDKLERAILINHFLEQFRTTLYRQTMFAEFELKMNQQVENNQPLTAESLCQTYLELNKLYYGPDVISDPEIALEWARIPHFFYNYYVYQYSTGFAAAIALAQRILKEGQPAVDDYLKFLSGGCSADPITLLKGAGVDMTTTEPINTALAYFGQLIDEMAELLA